MPENLPQFVISFDEVEGEIVFTVREEQARDLAVYYASTLMEAQDWTLRPHCTFAAVYPDMGAAMGFGDGVIVETCDRPIAARIYTHSEQIAAFDPESNGNDVYYLCDGHAAELRVDIAEEGELMGDSILRDEPVTAQLKSPHLA